MRQRPLSCGLYKDEFTAVADGALETDGSSFWNVRGVFSIVRKFAWTRCSACFCGRGVLCDRGLRWLSLLMDMCFDEEFSVFLVPCVIFLLGLGMFLILSC